MCLQSLGMSEHDTVSVAVCACSCLYDQRHLLNGQGTACDLIFGMLPCEEQQCTMCLKRHLRMTLTTDSTSSIAMPSLAQQHQLASCLEGFASCLESSQIAWSMIAVDTRLVCMQCCHAVGFCGGVCPEGYAAYGPAC